MQIVRASAAAGGFSQSGDAGIHTDLAWLRAGLLEGYMSLSERGTRVGAACTATATTSTSTAASSSAMSSPASLFSSSPSEHDSEASPWEKESPLSQPLLPKTSLSAQRYDTSSADETTSALTSLLNTEAVRRGDGATRAWIQARLMDAEVERRRQRRRRRSTPPNILHLGRGIEPEPGPATGAVVDEQRDGR